MSCILRRAMITTALGCSLATPLAAQDKPAKELAGMRAQLVELTQRIEQLESELAAAKAQPETAPSAATAGPAEADATRVVWKGAPELETDNGWSFKPRGRLQYDAGITAVPASTGREDGFGNEVRRARLGVSGDMPGGFGYKVEFDFAGDSVEAADAYLSYGSGPLEVIVGQHNNFQSLEELTSSLHTSFIERAAFTDAFGFERRIGVSMSYASGDVLVQGGVFTDNFDDTSSGNRGVDGRFVYMPKLGDTQLHLGGSIHYTHIDDPDATLRYRQRPLVHFTPNRFLDTGSIEAGSETGYGLEAAAVSGRFHAAAEGFWQKANVPDSLEDPTFFGGYLEAGVFLTDDTRGYKAGKFDRTKPARPVGEGGLGSLQFNLRYDHLDLNDAAILGGRQAGYLASLIWKPTDYTLLALNYGRLQYEDAVYPTASGDTSYGVDAVGVRAQVDF